MALIRKLLRRKQRPLYRGNRWELWVMFEPRDCWVGVFWDEYSHWQATALYICLIPCFPLYVLIAHGSEF